jgi:hypothetical protein
MKLSDKLYRKISDLIARETIYSTKDVYLNLLYLDYSIDDLLLAIKISRKFNQHLSDVCCCIKSEWNK